MNHMSVTVFIAAIAIGVGIGEVLLVASNKTVRSWGRALKLATPVTAGGWFAVYAVMGIDTDKLFLRWDQVLAYVLGLAVMTFLFCLMDGNVLQPTD